ncbi:hypothetical protein ABZ806_21875 [Spirillospora sp. NPDC047418]
MNWPSAAVWCSAGVKSWWRLTCAGQDDGDPEHPVGGEPADQVRRVAGPQRRVDVRAAVGLAVREHPPLAVHQRPDPGPRAVRADGQARARR